MTIVNCIPELWNVAIMTNLQKEHVFGKVCRCVIDAPITTLGQSVHIQGIGKINVRTYTGADLIMQGLSDSGMIMKIDKADYYDFWVNDVDKLQANANLMGEATQESAYEMKDVSDLVIYNELISAANLTPAYGTGATDVISIIGNIAECDLTLKIALIPKKMRWLVIPFWAGTKLLLAGIYQAQDLKGNINGFVTDVLGLDLYESANIATTVVVGGSYRAAAYAEQLVKTKAFEPEKNFGEALKGLHIYGTKVIRPNELLVGAWAKSQEALI